MLLPFTYLKNFSVLEKGDGMTSTIASNEELSEVEVTSKAQRLGSIDAYRGLVMFLMMGGGHFWAFLGFHYQGHVSWIGCTLHD
jgi:hypothetical protein